MSKHLNIYQTREVSEQNINSNTIKKLYDIVYKDSIGTELLDNSSNLYGKVNSGYTYKKYIDAIYEKFPKDSNLEITPLGLYIYFEDKTVEQILIDNFATGEEGILETLSVHVSNGFYANNKQVFNGNTEIETFDELGQLINVKKLGDSSFKNCTNLRSIDLSKLTQISSSAFYGCTSLKIDLNTPFLTTIGTDAFRESGITSILNLGSISTISGNAFRSCESLASINLDSVNIINAFAFVNCINLSEVINTQNLTQIGAGSFGKCSSLTSFPFNENITLIDNDTFSECTSLVIDNLSLPNLTYIGTSSFKQTKLKKVSNLGNITKLSGDAFNRCDQLTEVTLPNSLTIIDGGAFNQCTNLTTLNNVGNINTIGSWAFYKCNSLSLDASFFTSLTSIGESAFSGTNITGTIDLTNVTSINDNALIGSKITGITIPVSLQNKDILSGLKQLRNVNSNFALWTVVPKFTGSPNVQPFVLYQPLITSLKTGGILGTNWRDGELSGPSVWSQMYWPNASEIFNKGFFHSRITDYASFINGSRYYLKTIDLIYLKNIGTIDYYSMQYIKVKALIIDNVNVPLIPSHERDSDTIDEYMTSFINFNSESHIYVPDDYVDNYKAAWPTYANIISGISELNGGIKYATEAAWADAGKPVALIEEYMN